MNYFPVSVLTLQGVNTTSVVPTTTKVVIPTVTTGKNSVSDIKLSDQQYKIMRILWDNGSASAKEVQAAMGGELAQTTIGTMLTRLEKKGVLSSTTRGRERVFAPEITDSEVKNSTVSSLIATMFKGNPAELMAHLVKESEIDQDELDSIRDMLEESED